MMNTFCAIAFAFLSIVTLRADKSRIAHDPNFLKEYAFCKCFQYATDDSTYFQKRDISLSVYREFAADTPEDIFVKIDSLAKKAATSIEPSVIADHEGQKAVLKGCFNFYNSKELTALIDSYRSN